QVLGCSERETKLIAKRMRLAGWQGPKPIRIMGTNGKSVVVSGYEREVGKVPTVVDESQPVRGDLPSKLEAVTRLALREVGKVLKAPFDASDGVLTRNKVTAAGIAINAQLKADEQRLRTKQTGDVFARLLKVVEQEKRLLAEQRASKTERRPADESGKHQEAEAFVIAEALPEPNHAATEDVELERSDAEATVMASGGEGSEKG